TLFLLSFGRREGGLGRREGQWRRRAASPADDQRRAADHEEQTAGREEARESGPDGPGRLFDARASRARAAQEQADDRQQHEGARPVFPGARLGPHELHRGNSRKNGPDGPVGRVRRAFGAKSSTIPTSERSGATITDRAPLSTWPFYGR